MGYSNIFSFLVHSKEKCPFFSYKESKIPKRKENYKEIIQGTIFLKTLTFNKCLM
jgi:hypothetical protein